jgi:hypothetical protein
MTGELRPELDYARVEPPPLGASSALVVGGTTTPHIELAFDEGLLTRGDLDERFGEGRWMPRVDYDRPHMLAYDVRVEGAPNRCTMFGRFPEQPQSPDVPVTGVTLRVDP